MRHGCESNASKEGMGHRKESAVIDVGNCLTGNLIVFTLSPILLG
jgi:hypothetical protein